MATRPQGLPLNARRKSPTSSVRPTGARSRKAGSIYRGHKSGGSMMWMSLSRTLKFRCAMPTSVSASGVGGANRTLALRCCQKHRPPRRTRWSAGEYPHDRPVDQVGQDRHDGRGAAIVEQHEAGRLEQRRRRRRAHGRAHPRVNDREQDIHEGRSGEERVKEAEEGAEDPAGSIQGGEAHVVGDREEETSHEVQGIAVRPGPRPILRERGAQQKRNVHPGHPELGGSGQDRRQDQRSGKPPDQRAPETHERGLCMATAALMRARWTSPWGKLPRNAPVPDWISSEYRPTSFASRT